ncbi:MAG: TetR/AcrR family transcriptional regulator [Myxococcales bacterium]|nr:TetR/AcrR family transcriptional regulator [Myxococcales bacterium]MCB9647503.1 TetR/AcrR family transcriptional regulator [Deltaproteobacteria bacterium]
MQMLAHQGGLTLAAVGKAVGIADASVLKHFPSKEALIDAAVARFGQLLDEDLPEGVDDPLERLGVFFVRRLAKIRARPELMALAYNTRLADAAGPDGAWQASLHVGRSAGFILECVQQAQATGAMPSDVPPTMWVWIIAGLLRGATGGLPAGLAEQGAAPGEDARALSPERTWAMVATLMRGA